MATRKPIKFVIDKETTAGTDPVAPTAYVLGVNEISIGATPNTKVDDIIGGDIDFGGEEYTTSEDVSGGIKAPLYYEQVGVALNVILGDPVTTGTSPYVHTFKSTACIGSWVAEDTLSGTCDGSSDMVKRFNGLKGNTFSLSISPDGDYNYDISLVGSKGRDSLVDGISALDATNEITLASTRMKNAHATITIAGSEYKLAKDFSISIDRGTTAEKVIGDGAIVDDAMVKVTGSISSIFDDTVYALAKANTSTPAIINLTDGTNILKITLAETQFKFKDEPRKVGEKYPMNLDVNVFKKTGTEKIKVELTNSIASYH